MLHFHNHQILRDRANYFGSLQFQSLLSFTTLYKVYSHLRIEKCCWWQTKRWNWKLEVLFFIIDSVWQSIMRLLQCCCSDTCRLSLLLLLTMTRWIWIHNQNNFWSSKNIFHSENLKFYIVVHRLRS